MAKGETLEQLRTSMRFLVQARNEAGQGKASTETKTNEAEEEIVGAVKKIENSVHDDDSGGIKASLANLATGIRGHFETAKTALKNGWEAIMREISQAITNLGGAIRGKEEEEREKNKRRRRDDGDRDGGYRGGRDGEPGGGGSRGRGDDSGDSGGGGSGGGGSGGR